MQRLISMLGRENTINNNFNHLREYIQYITYQFIQIQDHDNHEQATPMLNAVSHTNAIKQNIKNNLGKYANGAGP